MTAEPPAPPAPADPWSTARHPDRLSLPGWVLAVLVVVFAGVALAAATERWVGVVVIVALVAGVCTLLLRWSR